MAGTAQEKTQTTLKNKLRPSIQSAVRNESSESTNCDEELIQGGVVIREVESLIQEPGGYVPPLPPTD